MSCETIAKLGGFTVVATCAVTTAAKDLGTTNARNLIIYNSDTTNPAFVNSGSSAVTVTYPTTGAGQNGAIIAPGQTFTYMKNNASDTHLGIICAAGTPTLFIQSANGE
jgi:hypothetical protein